MMRTLKVVFVVFMVILCAGSLAYAAGDERGGGHSGGYHQGGGQSGGHHGGSRFDVVIGGPYWGWGPSWYYPYYYPYYPYYYYPYSYPYYYSYDQDVSVEPREYIERSQEEQPSTPSGVWYYCPKSKAYYPYVRECPDGWQKVPAQPPSESGK